MRFPVIIIIFTAVCTALLTLIVPKRIKQGRRFKRGRALLIRSGLLVIGCWAVFWVAMIFGIAQPLFERIVYRNYMTPYRYTAGDIPDPELITVAPDIRAARELDLRLGMVGDAPLNRASPLIDYELGEVRINWRFEDWERGPMGSAFIDAILYFEDGTQTTTVIEYTGSMGSFYSPIPDSFLSVEAFKPPPLPPTEMETTTPPLQLQIVTTFDARDELTIPENERVDFATVSDIGRSGDILYSADIWLDEETQYEFAVIRKLRNEYAYPLVQTNPSARAKSKFSPDETKIAYVRQLERGGDWMWMLHDRNKLSEEDRTIVQFSGIADRFHWVSNYQLGIMLDKQAILQTLDGERIIEHEMPPTENGFLFSPDGNYLIYSTYDERIWMHNFAQAETQHIGWARTSSYSRSGQWAIWEADSRRVVFSNRDNNDQYSLILWSVDTGQWSTLLANGKGFLGISFEDVYIDDPCWIDENHIFVSAYSFLSYGDRSYGDKQLYPLVVDVRTGKMWQLEFPDGERLDFHESTCKNGYVAVNFNRTEIALYRFEEIE